MIKVLGIVEKVLNAEGTVEGKSDVSNFRMDLEPILIDVIRMQRVGRLRKKGRETLGREDRSATHCIES